MAERKMFIALMFVATCVVSLVNGNGRLMDPVSRNSAWRKGFNTPPNYTDNEQNCGGTPAEWPQKNGKCGTCGDSYAAKPRKYEHPSRHATGTIVKTYRQGDVITATVRITANHMGAFEFRIADIGTPPITQEKLNKHLLELADGSGTRWPLPRGAKEFSVKLKLPDDLVCKHCVLQWWWKVGNSWGCDSTGCGLGKGAQETFVNCADVTIQSRDGTPTTPSSQPQPPLPTQAPGGCRATGPWTGDAAMDAWCKENCAVGNCPPTHCKCY